MEYITLESVLYFSHFEEYTLKELWLEYYKEFIRDFFKVNDVDYTVEDYVEKYIADKDERFIIYFNEKFNEFLEDEIDAFIRKNPNHLFYDINDDNFMDEMEVDYDLLYKIFKNEDCVVNINKFFGYEFLDKDKFIEYYKLAYKK
jgi:hypothetical protein